MRTMLSNRMCVAKEGRIMASTARRVAMASVAVAILAGPRVSAGAQEAAPPLAAPATASHVRSASPSIAALIKQASEQSATFGRMVETIDASDSYVFVNEGECGHSPRACFVNVTMAGQYRFMWVRVDTRRADWDLMGSIGHELRHTIEVIGSPSVTSGLTMQAFYEQNGMLSGIGTLETAAALDAGYAVRSEVRAFNRHAKRHVK
jgi:hypothetical protein